MKPIALFVLLFASTSHAGVFRDCNKDDKCSYKECAAQVVENVGNTAMATCREVYFGDKLRYYEVKILSQRIDPETKKSVITGNTLRVK